MDWRLENDLICLVLELIIPARELKLGPDMTVRRLLPYAKKRMIGPFIFWDHIGPLRLAEGNEIAVRAHPHIGLSTLTYLFRGELLHRDSLGNEQVVRPGEVNWMVAGKGIAHSERTEPIRHLVGQEFEGIQIWIALPKDLEDVPPSFRHFTQAEIPTVAVSGSNLNLIAGQMGRARSPVAVHSSLFLLEGRVAKDATIEIPLTHSEGAIYVVSGEVSAGNQIIGATQMAAFNLNSRLKFTVLRDSHILILGGQPFSEPRYIWWNFVSSSLAKIEEAKIAWREHRFGKVLHENDVMPLPET